MKNNKGFTLIELAVSFCLVATISIMLLQLVLSLKEIYVSGDIKTTLLNKQGIMTKKIYDDLNSKELSSITSCGLSCLTFTYTDKTSANLLVDPGNKTLTYGDYTLQLDNSSTFGKVNISYDETLAAQSIKSDSVLTINIPIYSKLIEEDFGIHIVKKYNRNITTINNKIDITSTKATISGVDMNMAYAIDSEDSSKLAGIFIKLFHQQSGSYISNFDTFLKNKTNTTLSSLTSLEAFRTTIDLNKVISSQETIINADTTLSEKQKTKQINSMKENFQNGYFSLLLDYNGSVNVIDLSSNYTWWYQTSNFAKKENLSGVITTSDTYNEYLIPTQYSGDACKFSGLKYNSDANSWADGCDESHYAIGLKSGNILSPSGTATTVDLWAGAREYVCNYALSDVTINGVSIKSKIWTDGTSLCNE